MQPVQDFILGLGGRHNIVEAVPAFTRIRIKVRSMAVVNDDILRVAGAFGVVRQKGQLQLIVAWCSGIS